MKATSFFWLVSLVVVMVAQIGFVSGWNASFSGTTRQGVSFSPVAWVQPDYHAEKKLTSTPGGPPTPTPTPLPAAKVGDNSPLVCAASVLVLIIILAVFLVSRRKK